MFIDTKISVVSEGGSGTPVPDLFIEVDDLDIVLKSLKAKNIQIEYGPVSEPWGVRRFYVRDPFGKLMYKKHNRNIPSQSRQKTGGRVSQKYPFLHP